MKHIDGIDGIRAIAVLSVVAYHAKISFVPGGFLGVDVFFVISGFLISRNILKSIATDTFSYTDFLIRRIRRIAPAALLWTLLSGIFFAAFFPPSFRDGLSESVAFTLISASNFYFYKTIDYFGGNEFNPLLHTWSLAVEEQFYLVFPWFLLLTRPKAHRGTTLGAVILVLFISLFASTVAVQEDRSAAFYFTWYRAWEFLVGTLVAVLTEQRHGVSMLRHLLLPALFALLGCIASTEDTAPFPGIHAAPVVFSTAMLIAALMFRDSVSPSKLDLGHQLLASKALQWIGKISYSVYLAHWPITCVVERFLSLNGWRVQSLTVFLSILFGWLSWKLIENPVRHVRLTGGDKQAFSWFVVASTSVLCIYALASTGSGLLWRNVDDRSQLEGRPKEEGDIFGIGECFITPKSYLEKPTLSQSCFSTQGRPNVILLVGDSHAANLSLALKHHLSPETALLQITAAGCFPFENLRQQPHCDVLKAAFDDGLWMQLKQAERIQVVLAARWSSDQEKRIAAVVSSLSSRGAGVLVLGRWPEYYMPVPLAQIYSRVVAKPLLNSLEKQDIHQTDDILGSSPALRDAYVSPYEVVSDALKATLSSSAEELYFDKDHLTYLGSTKLVPLLRGRLGAEFFGPTGHSNGAL